MESGADVYATNDVGQTAIDLATSEGKTVGKQILELLFS